MKKINKSLSLLLSILLIISTFATEQLAASLTVSESTSIDIVSGATPIGSTPPEHKIAVMQFVTEIRLIQNQVYGTAQFALNNTSINSTTLRGTITLISNNIKMLRNRVMEYSDIIPSVGNRNRDVLLLLNALNFINNSLNTLYQLSVVQSDIERISLLDEFFRFRIHTKDTLATIEDLLSR
ncbi:MAG: hypothetical protein K0R69_2157 [Clostridia bacterium]|jgi:hypothetical protein|nr:hypothetical protein [Clostridia bacterium]